MAWVASKGMIHHSECANQEGYGFGGASALDGLVRHGGIDHGSFGKKNFGQHKCN